MVKRVNMEQLVEQGSHSCCADPSVTVSEYEIILALSHMCKTASGPDGIPYWIFCNCACELSAIIASFINSSLSQGKSFSLINLVALPPLFTSVKFT